MKKVSMFLALMLLAVSAAWAANVDVILDSTNGSSGMVIKNSVGTGVATLDSSGNAQITSKMSIGYPILEPNSSLTVFNDDGAGSKFGRMCYIKGNLNYGVHGSVFSGGTAGLGVYDEGSSKTYGVYSSDIIAGNYFAGSVGIGTTNPQGKLHVATLEGQANLVVNSTTGNVGIGTTSPRAALEVKGKAVILDNSTNLNTFVSGGDSTTNGKYNTAVGYRALYTNTSGSNNTAVGYHALLSNLTGGYNTAVGKFALHDNITGGNNTSIGYGAGYNALGSYNVFIGPYAGYSAAGNGNVFMGNEAGYNETGSNKLYIANSSTNPPLIYGDFGTGNVGIGTTGPQNKLDIEGGAAVGEAYSGNIAAPDNGLIVQGRVGIEHTNPGSGLQVGTNCSIGTGAPSIAAPTNGLYVGGEPRFPWSNSNTTGNAGNVNIDANGTLRKSTSSLRYKKDIRDYEIDVNKIMQFRPRRFKMNENTEFNGKEDFGLIAEEVYNIFPELVTFDNEGKIDGLQYPKLAVILIKGYQEKAKKIEELEARVKAIEGRMGTKQ
jgi:hypothetical protein